MPSPFNIKYADEGVAFPTNPRNGRRFFRTDLGLLCYYKASAGKWLTVNEYTTAFVPQATVALNTMPMTASVGSSNFNAQPDSSQAGMWIERYVLSMNSSTGDNTNYTTVQFLQYKQGTGFTNIGASFTTQTDTANTWVMHTVTVAAAITAASQILSVSFTRTANPGNVYAFPILCVYRLIVI